MNHYLYLFLSIKGSTGILVETPNIRRDFVRRVAYITLYFIFTLCTSAVSIKYLKWLTHYVSFLNFFFFWWWWQSTPCVVQVSLKLARCIVMKKETTTLSLLLLHCTSFFVVLYFYFFFNLFTHTLVQNR